MGLIKNTFLTSYISMTKQPNKVLNTFIYKILFDLSESSKITWFKDLLGQINDFKAKEKGKKSNFT